MDFLLVLAVLLPMIGSVALFSMPQLPRSSARMVALGVTLATLGISLILLLTFQANATGPQFSFVGEDGKLGLGWMPGVGVRFALGLDGISLWLFLLSSLLMVTAIFSSWESVTERAPAHYGLLLALLTGLLGLFASLDVILFYIFFEFTLIPLFFLIGIFGGPDRRRASVTFFLYTLAGSLLTLAGVIALIAVHYQHTTPNVLTFSIPELTEGLKHLTWAEWTQPVTWGAWRDDKAFWMTPQVAIFLLLFAGFAIKAALCPFHTWLPLAYVEAPSAGSILLAGVMAKVGTYGFLRFNMAMTPIGTQALSPLITTLAVVGILYGALAALAQSDVKRLVAYSSFSHMGFIMLGLFSLNATGIDGAVIQMVNHGVTTGALFACVGVIYERYHTRDMSELGGLWDRLPVWAFFLTLAAMGSAAVPGLNGFVGEFPILLGMFRTDRTIAVFASVGMILGAYYLMTMLQKLVFGPLKEPTGPGYHPPQASEGVAGLAGVRPLGWHEIAGLTPLMVLIVVMGIYPKPFLDRIQPPLVPIVAEFHKVRFEAVAGRGGVPSEIASGLGEIPAGQSASKLIGD